MSMAAAALMIEGVRHRPVDDLITDEEYSIRLGHETIFGSGQLSAIDLPEIRAWFDEPQDVPWDRVGYRRTHRANGKKLAVGRYKGSRSAKKASRRGGNPAKH